MSWTAHIITLMPEAFPGLLGQSLSGRALEKGIWSLQTEALRNHGLGKHQNVDDTPAGGGAGMVIRADVAAAAIDAACGKNPDLPLLVPSPRGAALTQDRVKRLAAGPGVMIFCPRFEGVDERLFQRRRIEEVSLGDYVLSGGDMAAQVIIDAVVRLLPGVMGGAESSAEESFENHLLEYPHYTRPAVWEDMKIPDVLTSGNHEKVSDWRRMEAEKLTKIRRPDLFAKYLSAQKDEKG
ncbi:MAG: tRNA (guanosine(37)-N1)-methyltransferase TrmD [Parvibaculales bacterium]